MIRTVALVLATSSVALAAVGQLAKAFGYEPSARLRVAAARPSALWSTWLFGLTTSASLVYVVGLAWGWWL